MVGTGFSISLMAKANPIQISKSQMHAGGPEPKRWRCNFRADAWVCYDGSIVFAWRRPLRRGPRTWVSVEVRPGLGSSRSWGSMNRWDSEGRAGPALEGVQVSRRVQSCLYTWWRAPCARTRPFARVSLCWWQELARWEPGGLRRTCVPAGFRKGRGLLLGGMESAWCLYYVKLGPLRQPGGGYIGSF